MTGLKLALRLAFSRDLRQRWRQLCVIGAAFIAVVAVLTGMAIVHAGWASQQRVTQREPQVQLAKMPATGPAVGMSMRGLILDRKQFTVIWLHPNAAGETAPALIPPGLSRLPEPGSAVLSPGIESLGFTAEDLGFKNSSAGSGRGGAIGDAGLETRTEYLMYVRPAPGQDLGRGGALGTVTSFGGPKLGLADFLFTANGGGPGIDGQLPPIKEALLFAIVLILCPCLYLIVGAARAMSPIRSQRAEFLWRLGVSRRKIRLILLSETAVLAAVGAGVALGLWAGVSHRITALPLSETGFVPGDFALPGYAVAATPLVLIALMALSAIFGRIGAPLPARAVRRYRAARIAPVILFVLAMLLIGSLPIDRNSKRPLLLLAMLGIMGSLPISLPALVAYLAPKLAPEADRVAWLAGRRLSLKSKNLSRPAAVVAALILVTGVSLGLYQKIIQGDGEGASSGVTVFSTTWRGEQPGDIDRLRDRLADYQVVPEAEGALIFTDCRSATEFAKIFNSLGCTDGKLAPELRELGENLLGGVKIKLGVAIPREVHSAFIVHPKIKTEPELMRDIGGTLPAVNNLNLLVSDSVEHRAGWVALYWLLGSSLLLFGVVREVGDRGLLSLAGAKILRRLSLKEAEVQRLNRWTLFLPVAIAVPIGYLGAVLFSLVGGSIELTAGGLGLLSIAIAGACAVCAVVFAGITALSHRIEAQDLV